MKVVSKAAVNTVEGIWTLVTMSTVLVTRAVIQDTQDLYVHMVRQIQWLERKNVLMKCVLKIECIIMADSVKKRCKTLLKLYYTIICLYV